MKYLYERMDFGYKLKKDVLKYPIITYLKITNDCMLNCEFCSQKKGVNNIELEFCKNILKQLKRIGVIDIYYTGGEPLMHPNISEILKYGYELGFKQNIITNALLLDGDRQLKIMQYINSIGVSLHGTKQMHNNLSHANVYDKVLNNVKLLKSKYPNIHITINCTVTDLNLNLDEILSVATVCKENGYYCNVARLNYIGNGEKYEPNFNNINKLLNIVETLRKKEYNIGISNCIASCVVEPQYAYLIHGCDAGNSFCAIEANGDVKVCASAYNAIGNLNKNTFKQIWKKRKNGMVIMPRICQNCNNILKCKGGCKAECESKYTFGLTDRLVKNKYEESKKLLINSKVRINFRYIKRQGKNFILMSRPIRLVNKETLKLIKIIEEKEEVAKVLSQYSEKEKENIIDLLISMYYDNVIVIQKEEIVENEENANTTR